MVINGELIYGIYIPSLPSGYLLLNDPLTSTIP